MATTAIDSHCTSETCPSGNCEGCLNGRLNCKDPDCSPYCRECENYINHDHMITVWFSIVIFGTNKFTLKCNLLS